MTKVITKKATRTFTGIPFAGDNIGMEVGIELKLSSEDDYGSSALSYNYDNKS